MNSTNQQQNATPVKLTVSLDPEMADRLTWMARCLNLTVEEWILENMHSSADQYDDDPRGLFHLIEATNYPEGRQPHDADAFLALLPDRLKEAFGGKLVENREYAETCPTFLPGEALHGWVLELINGFWEQTEKAKGHIVQPEEAGTLKSDVATNITMKAYHAGKVAKERAKRHRSPRVKVDLPRDLAKRVRKMLTREAKGMHLKTFVGSILEAEMVKDGDLAPNARRYPALATIAPRLRAEVAA